MGLEADRLQQRRPLVVVDGAAHVRRRRQQDVVLGVGDARGVVRPLDVGAEADEVVRLVAQHRAEGHAAEEVRAHLHPVQELDTPTVCIRVVVGPRISIHAPFRSSYISEVMAPRTPRADFARRAQAAEDRRRVAASNTMNLMTFSAVSVAGYAW